MNLRTAVRTIHPSETSELFAFVKENNIGSLHLKYASDTEAEGYKCLNEALQTVQTLKEITFTNTRMPEFHNMCGNKDQHDTLDLIVLCVHFEKIKNNAIRALHQVLQNNRHIKRVGFFGNTITQDDSMYISEVIKITRHYKHWTSAQIKSNG